MKGSQGLDALAELCGASSQQAKVAEASAAPSATVAAASAKSEAPKASQPPILPKATPQTDAPQPNIAQQPWQQAIAAGAVLGGNATNTAAAAQTMALLQQAAALQSATTTDPASFNAMQQFQYLQYMQLVQAAALQAQMGGAAPAPQVMIDATKVPMIFTGQAPQLATQTGKSFKL